MPPGMPPGMGGPPMGGPPMGGPPMGGPPKGAMRPMRRGTSKAIPVVVSAGLAVGVFCGLLFGVGTGKGNAAPAPAKGNNVSSKTDEMTTTPVTPAETQNKIVPTDKIQVKGAGSNAVVANGSAAGSAAGSAVAAAGSAAVAPKTAKLTIKVQPDSAATAAKIQVDGKDIDGNTIELPLDKKSVKITVTSSGYHQVDKQIDILGDETTVELPMTKRAASPGFGGTDTHKATVPTRPPGPDTGTTPTKPKKKPGGLIDI